MGEQKLAVKRKQEKNDILSIFVLYRDLCNTPFSVAYIYKQDSL